MQSKATTVDAYLAELPADRRAIIAAVLNVIRESIDPNYQEGMGYGMIGYSVPHSIYPQGYHCDPKQPLPFVGLASQKNYLSLYLGCYMDPEQDRWFRESWAKTGKKLDYGKSCVRFKKLDDLALDVVAEAIRRVPVPVHIAQYEKALADSRANRDTRKPAAGKAATKKSSVKKAATKKTIAKQGASKKSPAKPAKAKATPKVKATTKTKLKSKPAAKKSKPTAAQARSTKPAKKRAR